MAEATMQLITSVDRIARITTRPSAIDLPRAEVGRAPSKPFQREV
jgi:hypothetical protein